MGDFPPFPIEYLDHPDDELGALLLGYYVVSFAVSRGQFPDIPDEFVTDVISKLKHTNALPGNAAVEKALQKAAEGEFEIAGQTIRYYFENNAHHMAAVRIAQEEREKLLKGPRKGGEARKIAAAVKNMDRDNEILAGYYQLIASDRSPREIPAVLAKRFRLSPRRIRQILEEKRKPA